MKSLLPILGALLLGATTALHAQAPSTDPAKPQPRKERRYDCSKAADPKACEERRAKVKEAVSKARAACEGRQGEERRDCMRQQACAQAKDPAKCQANAKAHAERRQQAREACKGKTGAELKNCLREQRGRK